MVFSEAGHPQEVEQLRHNPARQRLTCLQISSRHDCLRATEEAYHAAYRSSIGLGIAGALIADWIGPAVHWYHPGQSAGFIASLIGALILLFIYRLFKGKPATA